MIDFNREKPMTLGDAAKTLPGKAASGSVCYHTLHRWATRGYRGLRLETSCVGNQRYTSAEALQRFIRSLSAVRDDDFLPEPETRRRRIRRKPSKLQQELTRRKLEQEHGIFLGEIGNGTEVRANG